MADWFQQVVPFYLSCHATHLIFQLSFTLHLISNKRLPSIGVSLTICQFIFQVQTVSISYLRCLIEHVRCYILDRDIELVYYTIRKSSDVLTRDPMQLGAQVGTILSLIFFFFSNTWHVLKRGSLVFVCWILSRVVTIWNTTKYNSSRFIDDDMTEDKYQIKPLTLMMGTTGSYRTKDATC